MAFLAFSVHQKSDVEYNSDDGFFKRPLKEGISRLGSWNSLLRLPGKVKSTSIFWQL